MSKEIIDDRFFFRGYEKANEKNKSWDKPYLIKKLFNKVNYINIRIHIYERYMVHITFLLTKPFPKKLLQGAEYITTPLNTNILFSCIVTLCTDADLIKLTIKTSNLLRCHININFHGTTKTKIYST